MLIKKNFDDYANRRVGLPPRSLALYKMPDIVLKLAGLKDNAEDIVVSEFGFNHANDTRFLCHLLLDSLGNNGWELFAYDCKDYFNRNNVFVNDLKLDVVRGHMNFIPCYFEEIAMKKIALPRKYDFVYSSKSLSLCKQELFVRLMQELLSRISTNGYLLISLHLRSNDPASYPFLTQSEYIHLFSQRDSELWCEAKNFHFEYSFDVGRCTFALYGEKVMSFKFEENTELTVNRNNYCYTRR